MKVGIVGLPNVGKSTLFNALTAAGAESANYPFCTIEPNVGIVEVPDKRLGRIQAHIESEKIIPAAVEIVDIAGLVAGASKGEGLGNQFLGHIRSVDAILHVVRCFEDENVVHVDGKIEPLSDIDTIDTELILADLESIEKQIDKTAKKARSGDKESKAKIALLEPAKVLLEQGIAVRAGDWDEEQDAELRALGFLTAKPVLFVCNVDEAAAGTGNALSEAVAAHAAKNGAGSLVLCAGIEEELADLDEEECQAFLEDLGLEEPGLHRLALAAYALLGLETYFTAGPKEIRAWTIKKLTKAPQAAGVIHTDFERGFIRAEVYTLPDLEELETEAAIKAKGRLRVEGKEYVVKDGDILHFRFNV